MYLVGYHMSVASAVGFIALGGMAAEFGVIMLLYLKQALERHIAEGEPYSPQLVMNAIVEVGGMITASLLSMS